MTTNSFGPQEVNLQIQPLPTYIDADGAFKINTPMLSTYNFDGLIPKKQEAISVTLVKPGYLIQINPGEDYYPVVSVEKDDPDLESTGLITFNYINSLGNTVSTEFDDTDTVQAIYEDWSEKVLGSQGWGITAGGNAIFTNVAVRGRIEAEEGYISGTLTIGSGGATTLNDVATTADLTGYIPDGSAAADIISNSTTITGGNISTGTIQSQYYSYTSGCYSGNGMQIGLDGNGYIRSPNFYLSTSGNAIFRGAINAEAGYFGYSNTISIGATASSGNNTSALQIGTLQIVGQSVSGSTYGSLSFFNTAGAEVGSIATRRSGVKGSVIDSDGLIIGGSTSEYLFIPAPTSASAAQYRGGGFRWYDNSNNEIMSIVSGGGNGLKVRNNLSIEVLGTGNYYLNGSVLSGGNPYVLSTSGPSYPSSYADGTVWYVY
jgi:hypothetical protein